MKRLLLLCSMLLPLAVTGQGTIELTGTVRDHATGQPLPFVNIVLQKAHRGAMTNEVGEFRLTLPESVKNDSVQFSFIGYSMVRRRVGDMAGMPADIRLRQEAFQLGEVVARPLTAEDYVRIAVERIPQNYSASPALATGYYYELVTENDRFLKFEEAVTSTYVPGISDTVKGHSSVLHARAAKDIATLQFMQSRNTRKEQRAKKKGKEYEPLIDGDDLLGGTGGPSDILGSDPIRDRPEFLVPKEFKHFRFTLESVVPYAGRSLLVITFKQRKKLDFIKADGKLYIDEDSYAFVAIEYDGKFIIPALLKPIIAMAGLGITNPTFNVRVHYREHAGRWHVASAHQDINLRLSTTAVFRKNDYSTFHIEQASVITELEADNVQPIPKEQRIDGDRPLSQQARNNDPAFWDSYQPTRPKRLETYLQ